MIAFNILLTFLLVLLNAFFVAAEFAIVKVRLSQIQLREQAGSRAAHVVEHIVGHLDVYLSATQLGITIASLGLGWIGEPVVSEIFIWIFGLFDISLAPATIHKIALPTAFFTITVLHITLGELVPKSMAVQYSERTAILLAFPLRAFLFIFKPFIRLLNISANGMLRLIGVQPVSQQELYSTEELRLILDQGKKSGAIKSAEHELITNVFEFSERSVRQIMVPRTRMIALDITTAGDRVVDFFIEEGFSRVPVYQGTIDNITGVVHAKDIIALMHNPQLIILQDLVRPAYFVPETKPISKLLRDFQRKRIHMAVVVDEFGGTSGLVTLEDIMEELVGEIQDEYDEEKPIVEMVGEREYNVRASAAISDVSEHLPAPLPESEQYDTVSGLVNDAFGRIPELNETINFAAYECTILQKTKHTVALVRLKQLEKPGREEDSEENS